MDKQKIRAIAFDLDGTLIDSLPDLADSANQVRADFNLPPLSYPRIRSYIGDGVRVLMHRVLTDNPNGRDEERIEKALALHNQYYLACATKNTTLYPNARETLEQLHAKNIPIALITNKSENHARAICEHFQILKYFSIFYGGDTLAQRKPSPLPLLTMSQTLNIPSAQILMVGDSINDLLSAHAAGAQSALVNFGYGDPKTLMADKNTQADHLITNLSDLLSLTM